MQLRLLQTFDLDEEAAQVLRDFIFFRAYISQSASVGDCEVEFIHTRTQKLADCQSQ